MMKYLAAAVSPKTGAGTALSVATGIRGYITALNVRSFRAALCVNASLLQCHSLPSAGKSARTKNTNR